jgi:hypothetical protein
MLHTLQQQMLAQAAQHSAERLQAIAEVAALMHDIDTVAHIAQHYRHMLTQQQQQSILATLAQQSTTAH